MPPSALLPLAIFVLLGARVDRYYSDSICGVNTRIRALFDG